MIHIITNSIPELRRILPFIDESRPRACHQFCDVELGHLEILRAALGIVHIQDAFRQLFACSSLPTPFWPLQKNCSHTGQLFCKDSITNSAKIIFHGAYYTINSGDGAMPIGKFSAKCYILIRSNVIMSFGRISNIDQSSTRFGSPRACFGSSTRPEIVRRFRWCSRR